MGSFTYGRERLTTAIGNAYMRFTVERSALLARFCMARHHHSVMIIKAYMPICRKAFLSPDITPWPVHIQHYPTA